MTKGVKRGVVGSTPSRQPIPKKSRKSVNKFSLLMDECDDASGDDGSLKCAIDCAVQKAFQQKVGGGSL